MKKTVHFVAAFVFIASMIHWVRLLIDLHAVEAWTDHETITIGMAFFWQTAVIIGTMPSIILLGSPILSRVLSSSATPQMPQPVVGEWSAVAAVLIVYLGMWLLPPPSSVVGYYLRVTLSLVLPLGVVWFVCRLNRQPSWAPGLSISVHWSGFFLALLALAAILLLNSFLRYLFPDVADKTLQQNYERFAAATLAHYPFHLIWVLLGGVTEELIFRGFVLSQIFLRTRSVGMALLASSLLFGLIHLGGGWYYAFATGAYGLCFGIVALWRRNLFPAILAHVWLNLLILYAMGARMAGYPWGE